MLIILYILSIIFCLCLFAIFVARDVYEREFSVCYSLLGLIFCFIPIVNVFLWILVSMGILYTYILPYVNKFEDMINKRN